MNPIVFLKNVNISQNNTPILTNINLTIKKGEFIYFIGKTGVGKSSLLRVLYGDIIVKEGEARILDTNLNKIKDKEIPFLRRKLGVVFQDFKLLSDRSIFENLSFVLKATGWKDKAEIKNRIEEVLSSLGVAEIARKYAFQISGGEQQRVAIARALLNSPELIIADEPTGNLDPQTRLEIMEVFRGLHQKGMTIIMATHDYNMIVKFPGKILRCDEGKIYEVVQKNEA